MKRSLTQTARFMIFLITFATLLHLISSEALAQTFFFADFEDQKSEAFPNKKVNDEAEWNKQVQGKGLANWIADKGALRETQNDCANSTTTLLPDPLGTNKNWTDYTVEIDFTWEDNDDWAIAFRRSNSKSFYFFAISASEEVKYFLGKSDDGAGTDAVCIEFGGKSLAVGPREGVIDETGQTVYTMKASAIGNEIKIYFGEKGAVELLDTVKDSTYKQGTVGVFNGTIAGTIDNVRVYGKSGPFAVGVQDKLATTWAKMKKQR